MSVSAEIGIFGGSGVYAMPDVISEVTVETPYGKPSAPISIAEIAGTRVAFLPRHGTSHQFPPHKIPYRANVWALHSLGVRRLIAPVAAGSLQASVRRGDFVVCDQLVDRTSGREATFYDGPQTAHVGFADPFCSQMRTTAIACAREANIEVHESGTIVVIEGPRFSTRAESAWFASHGWEVINMTQYPESVLARELEMCYCNISLITDYDVGVAGVAPVSVDEVIKVFHDNNERLRTLLYGMVAALATDPAERSCECATALRGAIVGGG